ncbi:hypothetical protein HAX54_003327 [Datura stramonium]|uniref:Uncharacterized protein n=1 Tax=Datura stramonium TaxID=4076 RepID=A0ABS8T5V2_DATST|nr:hypothetical protein [Datura stramonium]
MDVKLVRQEVVEFFENFSVADRHIHNRVRGVSITFDMIKLSELLGIPCDGFGICQQKRWLDAALYLDMILMELLGHEMLINLPRLMISYLTKFSTDIQQNHSLPYGFLLTSVFEKLDVPLLSLEPFSLYDVIDYYDTGVSHRMEHIEGPSVGLERIATSIPSSVHVMPPTVSVQSDLAKILQKNKLLCLDNGHLQAQITHNEELSTAWHNNLVAMIQGFSQPSSLPLSTLHSSHAHPTTFI